MFSETLFIRKIETNITFCLNCLNVLFKLFIVKIKYGYAYGYPYAPGNICSY